MEGNVSSPLRIGFVLFEGVNGLDVVGPYEVLSRLRQATCSLVADTQGPVLTDSPPMQLMATHAWEDLGPMDILVIPGGKGSETIGVQEAWISNLTSMVSRSREVLTICTGGVLLARTQQVDGLLGTTHWAHRTQLENLGVRVSTHRTERDGRWWSGAGVSAGIDLALRYVGERISPALAHTLAVAMEYDPQPPFGVGRLDTLPVEKQDRLRTALAPLDENPKPLR